MKAPRFKLPPAVLMRAKTHGHVGSNWVEELDRTVAALEAKWAFEAGEVLSGGSESLVVTARYMDGTEAILKVGLPNSADLATEAHVYRLAAGRGVGDPPRLTAAGVAVLAPVAAGPAGPALSGTVGIGGATAPKLSTRVGVVGRGAHGLVVVARAVGVVAGLASRQRVTSLL